MSEPALGTIQFVHDLVQEFPWVRDIHAGLDDEEMKLPHVVLGPVGIAFDSEVLLETSATSHASTSAWLRLLRWIETRPPGTEDDRNGVVNLVSVSFVEEFLQPVGTAAFDRACNLLPPKSGRSSSRSRLGALPKGIHRPAR